MEDEVARRAAKKIVKRTARQAITDAISSFIPKMVKKLLKKLKKKFLKYKSKISDRFSSASKEAGEEMAEKMSKQGGMAKELVNDPKTFGTIMSNATEEGLEQATKLKGDVLSGNSATKEIKGAIIDKMLETTDDLLITGPGAAQMGKSRAAFDSTMDGASKALTVKGGSMAKALKKVGIESADSAKDSLLRRMIKFGAKSRKIMYRNSKAMLKKMWRVKWGSVLYRSMVLGSIVAVGVLLSNATSKNGGTCKLKQFPTSEEDCKKIQDRRPDSNVTCSYVEGEGCECKRTNQAWCLGGGGSDPIVPRGTSENLMWNPQYANGTCTISTFPKNDDDCTKMGENVGAKSAKFDQNCCTVDGGPMTPDDCDSYCFNGSCDEDTCYEPPGILEKMKKTLECVPPIGVFSGCYEDVMESAQTGVMKYISIGIIVVIGILVLKFIVWPLIGVMRGSGGGGGATSVTVNAKTNVEASGSDLASKKCMYVKDKGEGNWLLKKISELPPALVYPEKRVRCDGTQPNEFYADSASKGAKACYWDTATGKASLRKTATLPPGVPRIPVPCDGSVPAKTVTGGGLYELQRQVDALLRDLKRSK